MGKTKTKGNSMRLDKFLAEMKQGSRSEVRELIRKGMVTVDGEVCREAEKKIDPDTAFVACGGVSITFASKEYFMLNKPQGVVSATEDHLHRTVLDLIGDARRKDLFPVGRLDIDTEGLLLITNDGALAHDLLSPKKHVDKVYFARVEGVLPEDAADRLGKGMTLLDGTPVLPARLLVESTYEAGSGAGKADGGAAGNADGEADGTADGEADGTADGEADGTAAVPVSEVRLTIREGKFHQVKRMFEALGTKVIYLKRLSMGPLKLDESLKPGEYRPLTEAELAALRERRQGN